MLHVLWMIGIGFVAGFIARLIVPGGSPGGFVVTTLLGIAGAFAAKYMGEMLHWYRPGQPAGLIGSILGAVVLLAVYHFIQRRRLAS